MKKEFFARPSVGDITRDKTRVRYSGNLAVCIEKLKQEEYIELDYGLVPSIYEDWQNFLKRGPKVQLIKYFSRENAIQDRIPFYIQRERRFESLDNKLEYAGYGWWGIRERRRFSSVFLTSCIDGAKLFIFAENNGKKQNKIEILSYKDVKDVEQHGGKYILKVPSRSTRPKYHVALENIPIGKRDDYPNIYDLSYEHTCPSLVADITFRYTVPGKAFCPHVIAAYMKGAQYNFRNGNRAVMLLNPFAVVHQSQVDFDRKVRENVVVKLEGRPRRRLNMAEREILNWERVKLYGNPRFGKHYTFYAPGKEKLQGYDW